MAKKLVLKGNLTKEDFRKRYRKCKDVRLRERYQSMYLSFTYDWKEIADIIGVDYRTIMEWANAYNESGIPGLIRGKPTGRLPSLSGKQKSILKCMVSNSPRKLGMRFSNWTCKTVGGWIKKSFRVTLSAERIRQILHELGFVMLKPAYRYVLADKDERKGFIKTITRRMDNLSNNEMMLFLDESTVKQHPRLTSTWSLKGVKRLVNTFGNHAKVCIFGAVDPIGGSLSHMKFRNLKSANFIRFLKHIKANRRGKDVIAVLDSSQTHAAKKVIEFMEDNTDWLEVIWLPKYSPDFNPIEHFWCFMKSMVSSNYLFGTVNEMIDSLSDFFNGIRYAKEKILSICSVDYLFGKL